MKPGNLRRLMNEIKQIEKETENNKKYFILKRPSEDMFHWEALINGPDDSLYQGYKFKVDIQLSKDYPTEPFIMKFISPIKHVNVDAKGDICMDILKDKWSSAINMSSALISLISLLADPNPTDPFDHDLAEIYRRDKKKYEKTIRDACHDYAIKKTD